MFCIQRQNYSFFFYQPTIRAEEVLSNRIFDFDFLPKGFEFCREFCRGFFVGNVFVRFSVVVPYCNWWMFLVIAVDIYARCGGYIYSVRWTYIPSVVDIYTQYGRYI
ncbi:hypothetical protein HMPREF1981_03521 [Bacteroides pyogenes F0041]|uniref:Uncharacterized protein n=1 Tax=Bacteroides pyogenes F0041 TaxID=1321819 RepID=U2BS16_9BACE|nr:hypothetical protein HMPREF1981_03521 [Bacteroides pyogenes F0041]